MSIHLISLPEDLVEAIATRASLEGEAQLSGTCREFWARYHRKRAGVSLAGLAPSLTTGDVYARFGKDVRPLLAAVACTRAGNTRRYATVDVLAALLRAYGGWKGLEAPRCARGRRQRRRKGKAAFHRAVVQLEEFARVAPTSCRLLRVD